MTRLANSGFVERATPDFLKRSSTPAAGRGASLTSPATVGRANAQPGSEVPLICPFVADCA